jgi:hypothetical protein
MQARTRVRGTVITPAAAQLTLSAAAPTVTVGQIADALRDIEPDTATLTERIRSWTKQRILSPSENLGAGTGRHILYARDLAPYEAALLNALSRTGYVVGRPYVGTALARLREELPKWRAAHTAKRSPQLFLIITHPMSGGSHSPDPQADIVTKITPDPKAEAMIVINLGALFARVRA